MDSLDSSTKFVVMMSMLGFSFFFPFIVCRIDDSGRLPFGEKRTASRHDGSCPGSDDEIKTDGS